MGGKDVPSELDEGTQEAQNECLRVNSSDWEGHMSGTQNTMMEGVLECAAESCSPYRCCWSLPLHDCQIGDVADDAVVEAVGFHKDS